MELFDRPIPDLPNVPRALLEVLRYGMANDPRARPTAEQLREMLTGVHPDNIKRMDDMHNEIRVTYSDAAGKTHSVLVSRNNPRLPEGVTRTAEVSIGLASSAAAQAYGEMILALEEVPRGLRVLTTRVPGGSPGAEAIRMLLLEGEETLRRVSRRMGAEETFHATDVGVYFGTAGQTVPDPYFRGAGPARRAATGPVRARRREPGRYPRPIRGVEAPP